MTELPEKFRPMLAAAANIEQLTYPLLASPKLDGIRGVLWGGQVLSRSLKIIPNKHVQEVFSHFHYHGFDGEFIVGSPTAPDSYRVTNSALK